MKDIFQHGIAIGDLPQDRVILWTRITLPHENNVDANWEIAEDSNFTRTISSGKATADPTALQTGTLLLQVPRFGRNIHYRPHENMYRDAIRSSKNMLILSYTTRHAILW